MPSHDITFQSFVQNFSTFLRIFVVVFFCLAHLLCFAAFIRFFVLFTRFFVSFTLFCSIASILLLSRAFSFIHIFLLASSYFLSFSSLSHTHCSTLTLFIDVSRAYWVFGLRSNLSYYPHPRAVSVFLSVSRCFTCLLPTKRCIFLPLYLILSLSPRFHWFFQFTHALEH